MASHNMTDVCKCGHDYGTHTTSPGGCNGTIGVHRGATGDADARCVCNRFRLDPKATAGQTPSVAVASKPEAPRLRPSAEASGNLLNEAQYRANAFRVLSSFEG